MNQKKLIPPRTYVWMLHLICWLCIFALFILIRSVSGEHMDFNFVLRPFFILFHLYIVGLFYFNAYILVPHALYRKSVVFYIVTMLSFVFAAGGLIYTTTSMNHPHHHHHYSSFFFGAVFPGLFVCAVSTSYRIIADRLRSEQFLQEKENEHLKTELSFLRSQVSPHFMFNVLNNIVSLARKKSDLVEGTVIQLSHLMRYMLYESDESKVSLVKEIEYLRSYVDLQMMRFGNDVKVTFDAENSAPLIFIEPMLLIPFVENAFKHGLGMIEHPEITIFLRSTEKELVFQVKNKVGSQTKATAEGSGIGLQNVKRRLNLLYGENHRLVISESPGTFVVDLNLIFK
jgi:two-component system LytT family sensor kinase